MAEQKADSRVLERRIQHRFAHPELLETALSSFDSRDANRATRAYALEQRVDEMDELLRQRHIDRLNKNLCTPESGMLFTDVATNLERVADHAINIIPAADMD